MSQHKISLGIVLTCSLVSILMWTLSSCAVHTPGSHKEQRCTLIFQTPKMIVSPEGVLMVDQREVVSLNCVEVWVGPEEEGHAQIP